MINLSSNTELQGKAEQDEDDFKRIFLIFERFSVSPSGNHLSGRSKGFPAPALPPRGSFLGDGLAGGSRVAPVSGCAERGAAAFPVCHLSVVRQPGLGGGRDQGPACHSRPYKLFCCFLSWRCRGGIPHSPRGSLWGICPAVLGGAETVGTDGWDHRSIPEILRLFHPWGPALTSSLPAGLCLPPLRWV